MKARDRIITTGIELLGDAPAVANAMLDSANDILTSARIVIKGAGAAPIIGGGGRDPRDRITFDLHNGSTLTRTEVENITQRRWIRALTLSKTDGTVGSEVRIVFRDCSRTGANAGILEMRRSCLRMAEQAVAIAKAAALAPRSTLPDDVRFAANAILLAIDDADCESFARRGGTNPPGRTAAMSFETPWARGGAAIHGRTAPIRNAQTAILPAVVNIWPSELQTGYAGCSMTLSQVAHEMSPANVDPVERMRCIAALERLRKSPR